LAVIDFRYDEGLALCQPADSFFRERPERDQAQEPYWLTLGSKKLDCFPGRPGSAAIGHHHHLGIRSFDFFYLNYFLGIAPDFIHQAPNRPLMDLGHSLGISLLIMG
jgi:hypothetical protein